MASSIHPNMINEVMSAKKSLITPVPGLAATMFVGSDRYAMVVTKVITPKKIEVSHVYSENEFEFFQELYQTVLYYLSSSMLSGLRRDVMTFLFV